MANRPLREERGFGDISAPERTRRACPKVIDTELESLSSNFNMNFRSQASAISAGIVSCS
jgi:hypothetical protein